MKSAVDANGVLVSEIEGLKAKDIMKDASLADRPQMPKRFLNESHTTDKALVRAPNTATVYETGTELSKSVGVPIKTEEMTAYACETDDESTADDLPMSRDLPGPAGAHTRDEEEDQVESGVSSDGETNNPDEQDEPCPIAEGVDPQDGPGECLGHVQGVDKALGRQRRIDAVYYDLEESPYAVGGKPVRCHRSDAVYYDLEEAPYERQNQPPGRIAQSCSAMPSAATTSRNDKGEVFSLDDQCPCDGKEGEFERNEDSWGKQGREGESVAGYKHENGDEILSSDVEDDGPYIEEETGVTTIPLDVQGNYHISLRSNQNQDWRRKSRKRKRVRIGEREEEEEEDGSTSGKVFKGNPDHRLS